MAFHNESIFLPNLGHKQNGAESEQPPQNSDQVLHCLLIDILNVMIFNP